MPYNHIDTRTISNANKEHALMILDDIRQFHHDIVDTIHVAYRNDLANTKIAFTNIGLQGPLLLTWFNFNPSMYK